MFAVTVTDHYDNFKLDPSYVRLIAYLDAENGYSQIPIPTHKCTDEDLKQFYPPDEHVQEFFWYTYATTQSLANKN